MIQSLMGLKTYGFIFFLIYFINKNGIGKFILRTKATTFFLELIRPTQMFIVID